MSSNIEYLVGLQLPLLNVVVGTRHHEGRLVGAPANAKDRAIGIVVEHDLSLHLLAHLGGLRLIDDDVAIPHCHCKQGIAKLGIDLILRSKLHD
jgi:hypothetical protein